MQPSIEAHDSRIDIRARLIIIFFADVEAERALRGRDLLKKSAAAKTTCNLVGVLTFPAFKKLNAH